MSAIAEECRDSVHSIPTCIAVRRGRRVVFVRTAEIESLVADGNYVRISADGRSYLVRDSLVSMCGRLGPSIFVRIHRSAAVNVNRVSAIVEGSGAAVVVLASKRELPLAGSYHDDLRVALGLLVCRPSGETDVN